MAQAANQYNKAEGVPTTHCMYFSNFSLDLWESHR